MPLENYDSNSDFNPKGKLLSYWVSLPQSNNSVNEKPIPSLFGNLKSVLIPTLMVCLLVILEIVLAYQMNDEGLDILAIIALSIADFIIAIIPVFILAKTKPLAQIEAQIFILQTKQSIKNTNERDNITQELKKEKKIKNINYLFTAAIIALGIWKFVNYYNVLGSDIFILPLGRFILITVIIGIITHIYFTKVFFIYWILYKPALNNAKTKCRNREDFYIVDFNKEKLMDYPVEYIPASSGRQFLGEKVEEGSWSATDSIKKITDSYLEKTVYFRVNKFKDQTQIYLIYSGLLIDPEINQLFIAQNNDLAKEAVVALCKEIQLTQ
jgi:hypothetical protein